MSSDLETDQTTIIWVYRAYRRPPSPIALRNLKGVARKSIEAAGGVERQKWWLQNAFDVAVFFAGGG